MEFIEHDRKLFDDPKGWTEKKVEDAPLINNFSYIWSGIKGRYLTELNALAFSQIPDEKSIFDAFEFILSKLK